MQASCEHQNELNQAYASNSYGGGSGYAYDSGFSALGVFVANFIAFLLVLAQGLLAARRDKRARAVNA